MRLAIRMLGLLGVGVLGACTRSGEDGYGPEIDHSRLRPAELAGSVFNEAPAIGRPLQMRRSGDYLWISDGAGDPGLHVLNALTGEILRSIGRKGEGPGEFANAPTSLLAFLEEPGPVWAWDMSLQRLTRFEPKQPPDGSPEVIHLEGPRVRRVVWPDPNRLIGISMSAEERFAVFSDEGTFERFRAGPILGPQDVPFQVRLNATDGPSKACTWPGRGFAIINFFAGRIELYDVDAQFVRTADVPFASEPLFGEMEGGQVSHLTPRSWYYDCVANATTLFALFSGRLRSEYPGDARYSGQFIHVFDWLGNLLGVIHLDRDVRGIAVDDSGDVLYASSLLDSKIYRFDLSSLGW